MRSARCIRLRHDHVRRLRLLCILSALVVSGLVHAQPIESEEPGLVRWAELQVEHELMVEATRVAAAGDFDKALVLLTEEAAPGRIAFRVSAVAGFLQNQGLHERAAVLARAALAMTWSDARATRAGPERSEVAYWCARLARETLHDRALAGQWAREALANEPTSARARELLDELEPPGQPGQPGSRRDINE